MQYRSPEFIGIIEVDDKTVPKNLSSDDSRRLSWEVNFVRRLRIPYEGMEGDPPVYKRHISVKPLDSGFEYHIEDFGLHEPGKHWRRGHLICTSEDLVGRLANLSEVRDLVKLKLSLTPSN